MAKDHTDFEDVSTETDLPSVDDLVIEAEEHVLLKGCIEKLKQAQAHVIEMRLLEQKDGNKVGKLLGFQPGHVAVLLNRAKTKLVKCIRDS